jgi:dinuclear metal center YbgI/SA1388 family protein
MDFDNAGFQVGHADREVQRVLLALDATDAVVEEAEALGAELIVTHHPLLFSPLRSLTDLEPTQRRVLHLAEKGIGLISMHTNLDIVEGGVNDVLIRLLGAEPETALDEGCGRIGTLPRAMELAVFLELCRQRLQVPTLRFVDGGKPGSRLAVRGGAGAGSLEQAAAAGCDAYVTADVKYHQFQRAAELGMSLIDADHFYTENPVISELARLLSAQFPNVSFHISKRHEACIRFA